MKGCNKSTAISSKGVKDPSWGFCCPFIALDQVETVTGIEENLCALVLPIQKSSETIQIEQLEDGSHRNGVNSMVVCRKFKCNLGDDQVETNEDCSHQ